jgi:hypothetical protein
MSNHCCYLLLFIFMLYACFPYFGQVICRLFAGVCTDVAVIDEIGGDRFILL